MDVKVIIDNKVVKLTPRIRAIVRLILEKKVDINRGQKLKIEINFTPNNYNFKVLSIEEGRML